MPGNHRGQTYKKSPSTERSEKVFQSQDNIFFDFLKRNISSSDKWREDIKIEKREVSI